MAEGGAIDDESLDSTDRSAQYSADRYCDSERLRVNNLLRLDDDDDVNDDVEKRMGVSM